LSVSFREIELNDEKQNLNDRKHGDKNKGNTNFRIWLEEQGEDEKS
jgi:hypothetical protein